MIWFLRTERDVLIASSPNEYKSWDSISLKKHFITVEYSGRSYQFR